MGKIVDINEAIILENGREYIMADEIVGMVGIGPDLLPIVTMNGKAYKFSRDELIALACEQLSAQHE